MTENEMKKKLGELLDRREKFVVQVNTQLAHLNGQIEILQEMLGVKPGEENEEHAE